MPGVVWDTACERIVDFLHARGAWWAPEREIREAVGVDDDSFRVEWETLRDRGVIEVRVVRESHVNVRFQGAGPYVRMARLAAAPHRDGLARRRTQAMLRLPMVLPTACLSLADLIVQRARSHMSEHLCGMAPCPGHLLPRLTAQARAAVRVPLAPLTGGTHLVSQWNPADAMAAWRVLCSVAAQLGLDPCEAVDDAAEYVRAVLGTLSGSDDFFDI